jgi:hypothetical protein
MAERSRNIQVAKKAVDEIEERKRRILDAIEGIGYTVDLGERLKIAEREMDEATYEVFMAESEMSALDNADVDRISDEIASHFSGFERRTKVDQKSVLAECVQRIVVDSKGGKTTFLVTMAFQTITGTMTLEMMMS